MDLKLDQIEFDFMSSEGSFWYDCVSQLGKEPNQFIVNCQNYEFKVHLVLKEYRRDLAAAPAATSELTYELHFWADETKQLKESHTQSTWITTEVSTEVAIVQAGNTPAPSLATGSNLKNKLKNITSYIGFLNDTNQLRVKVNLAQ